MLPNLAGPLSSVSALSMTSREIAELTGKEHKTVLRDIRAMLVQLYGQEHIKNKIPEQYRNRHSEYIREHADEILLAITGDGTNWGHEKNQGFKWERDNRGYISVFYLDKDHTLTLLSGYDVQARMTIVKRWQELEAGAAATQAAAVAAAADKVMSPGEILMLQAQAIMALEQQVALATNIALNAEKKAEDLLARVENVELQHRNGVPKGYVSRAQARRLYAPSLSEEIFNALVAHLRVPSLPYVHTTDAGVEVATFALEPAAVKRAVDTFLEDAVQATDQFCESPMLGGRRFRYSKLMAMFDG